MRLALALLLLLAGLFHPLAHFADEAAACPCVHAAAIELAAPATAGLTLTATIRTTPPARSLPAPFASDVPARAPPVA